MGSLRIVTNGMETYIGWALQMYKQSDLRTYLTFSGIFTK